MRANLTCEIRGPVMTVSPTLTPYQKLELLTEGLKQLPAAPMPVTEYFAKGLYAREIFIPQGVCLVGRIHKFEQITILLEGKMSLFSADGEMKEITGPCTFAAPAGVQRAAITHTDCRVTTIVATDVTDPDSIVDALTVLTHAEYLAFCASLEDKSK